MKLLILGKGEIARYLARIAYAAEIPLTVCEEGVAAGRWPSAVELIGKNFVDEPWPLAPHTHVVIARGHDRDALSVKAALEHGAERVYLIASSRRAESIIQQLSPELAGGGLLDALSAPAGLDLGGNSSAQIALSILAEIQWRSQGKGKSGLSLPLQQLRLQGFAAPARITDDDYCPGKRA